MVRKDPSIIDTLANVISNLIDILYTENTDDEVFNRMLSLIALKHDILLQQNITRARIDSYLADILNLLDKKAYLVNVETPLKFLECLAKTQFACNLVDYPLGIQSIYEKTYIMFQKEKVFISLTEYLVDNQEQDFYHEMGVSYFYSYLFRNLVNDEYYDLIMLHILYRWKAFKMKHYKMSVSDLRAEGFKSYDIIYKE
jgi:hypothetical protein